MKQMKKGVILLCLSVLTLATYAQKITVIQGDLGILKGQESINTEFTYDKMSVGEFPNEADYVEKKKADYNKKEEGRGDKWAESWVNDRKKRFEPKFIELFEEQSGIKVTKEGEPRAKYTLIFKTQSTEPGYNVVVHRKNALIDGEVWIIEDAKPKKVLAKILVEKSKGRTFGGADYDTGQRISECYALAGKSLGKMVKKK